ncbi:MAG: transcriptional repressor [Candidatus Obscuribacterales bacterium]|nr:transcriptional repressor [Candidatus Obscuribacterales bacterium]
MSDTNDADRRTRQQPSLESFIKDLPRGQHLTAPEVYKLAREQGLRISLSTVYRTLHNMSSHGHVQAIVGEHGRRYEALDAGHDHDHLICVKCGLTIEFEDDLIAGFGKSVAEWKGYEYRTSRFDILGICETCRANGDDHKIESALNAIERVMSLCEVTQDSLSEAIDLFESRKLARGKDILIASRDALRQALSEIDNAIAQQPEAMPSPPASQPDSVAGEA